MPCAFAGAGGALPLPAGQAQRVGPACRCAWQRAGQSRHRLGATLRPRHVGGREAELAISGAAPPPVDAAGSGQLPAQV